MLYLLATPIGNLKDVSFRAVEILQQCDYILCEDTRHSLKLLSHYNIRKPLKSYHQHNEKRRTSEITADLLAGKEIVLISDAGTPGISDPGTILVQACREEGLSVTAIPGPCAAILALTASGLPTEQFQFKGFLPKRPGELTKSLQQAFDYPGTTIFYESPKRILATLKKINTLSPSHPLAIARELTKKFETHIKGTASELMANLGEETPKGECVLLIGGGNATATTAVDDLSPTEQVLALEKSENISQKEAIKRVAKARKVPKNIIYSLFHKT